MIEPGREHWPELADWFRPEQPGPVIGAHVIGTGRDAIAADRWPAPRVVLAQVAANVSIRGEPEALDVSLLPDDWEVLVEAAPEFEARLREAWPDLVVWDRVVFELTAQARHGEPRDADIRRLGPGDTAALERLDVEIAWIHDTLGGPGSLAASGIAFGAFVDGTLASVATPFLLGERYEDIGVVTEAAFRGRGLVWACAARVAEDILARGRTPSWTTSPDNLPSLRVAAKLGFRKQREDVLYVIGLPVPEVARTT